MVGGGTKSDREKIVSTERITDRERNDTAEHNTKPTTQCSEWNILYNIGSISTDWWAACCDNHTKNMSTLCGQNAEFINVTVDGTYCYH